MDFCKVSIQIAGELKLLGFQSYSNDINNIITSGSTGSEILMGLRWCFKQVLKNDKHKIPKVLSDEINLIIKKIDKALK